MQLSSTLFLLVLALVAFLAVATAQEDASVVAPPTQEELAKMPVKKLRQFLAARGLECKGCAEKEDFVKMAFDNKDTPLKQAAEPAAAAAAPEDDSPEAKQKKDKEMEDLMASLRSSGLGDGIKMFTKDDFAGLSPEQMAEKFGGGGGGGGRGRGGSSGRGSKGGSAGSRGKGDSSSRSKGGSSSGGGKSSKPSSKPSQKIKEEEGDVLDL